MRIVDVVGMGAARSGIKPQRMKQRRADLRLSLG